MYKYLQIAQRLIFVCVIYGKQAPTLILEEKKSISYMYVPTCLVYKITTLTCVASLLFNWDGEHYINIIRENILGRLRETALNCNT